VLLPRNRGKPFVGEEGIVAVGGQQELPDGSLIRVGLGQPEGSNYPFWSDRERYLEAVDPFGLGDAASEGGLSGEEALTGGSDSHDGRNEGGVEHMLNLRVVR
jgi:hypothetical protein